MRCVARLHTRLSCSWELICGATRRHEKWHAEARGESHYRIKADSGLW
jgi:hypothetical protein